MPRPKILFLSPTVPASSGQGSAMHAGVFLKLLAEHYDVVLCVLQLMPWSKFAQDQQTLSLCTEFIQFRFLFVGTMAYYPNEDAAL